MAASRDITQLLVLVRHAVAEDRETWHGCNDDLRPLTSVGRRQAKMIAKHVMNAVNALDRDVAIVSLRSSPAVRCVDTMRPLAEMAEVELEIDPRLMEGRTLTPPPPRERGVHILCAHGDNIPWLLDDLHVNWNGRCKKGSIWLVGRNGRGRVVSASYVRIPKS